MKKAALLLIVFILAFVVIVCLNSDVDFKSSIPLVYNLGGGKGSNKISVEFNSEVMVDMNLTNQSPSQPVIWELFAGNKPKGTLVLSGEVEPSDEASNLSVNAGLSDGVYTFLFYNIDGSELMGVLCLK